MCVRQRRGEQKKRRGGSKEHLRSSPASACGIPSVQPPTSCPSKEARNTHRPPGRKHESAQLCDSHHDLQPNLHHKMVLEVAEGKLKTCKLSVDNVSFTSKAL